eukprot:gene26562-biopygen16866
MSLCAVNYGVKTMADPHGIQAPSQQVGGVQPE